MSPQGDIDVELSRLAREHAPRVLALLAGRFGDVDLADEAVQEALIEATRTWPEGEVPSNPGAWLNTVARRKAIDMLRRADSARRRTQDAAPELAADPNDTTGHLTDMITDDPELDPVLPDDQLRMLFLCCHPALGADAQVALTLRLVGGLTTEEIAASFLVPTPTLAQRVSRAKSKIRDAGIPLQLPTQLDERLDVVLGVLYLVFNEGYLSRAAHETPLRLDLCSEALRLTRSLAGLLPHHPEIQGLLALILFHHSRREARLDANLDLVLLPDQDRSRWDQHTIAEGNQALRELMAKRSPGRYQLQALIAGYHTNATSAADTDWEMIGRLYDTLATIDRSPIVALNRAVAISMVSGGAAGLAALDELQGLDEYHLFHATRAEMYLLDNQPEPAIDAFHRARELARNPAEIRHLDRRLATV